ncbi:mfs sp sugar:h+ symporter [Nannochloropsis oceanica]
MATASTASGPPNNGNSSNSSSSSSSSSSSNRGEDQTTTVYPVKRFVYVIANITALSGLLFGYDIGGSGGTFEMAGFRNHFNWPALGDKSDPAWVANQQGWITAMFSLGCIVGSMPSGALTDFLGRKKCIILLSFIFSVGAIIQLVPRDYAMLLAGRFLSGIGVGGLSMAATLYQSETAPSQVRGLVVSIQQLSITGGILLAGALNVGLQHWEEGWRISYGGKGFFSILLMFLMLFLPESPRWLVAHGKSEEAKAALLRIRQEEEVEGELAAIESAVESEARMEKGAWKDLVAPGEYMWYRTMLGFGIQLLQQFSGINAVMYFAPVIFKKFLASNMAIVANLAVALVNYLSTFLALYLVDKAGRRVLLVLGGLGMALFTGLFALFTSAAFHYETDKRIAGAVIACTALYVMNFAYSWGPLAWVVAAEIFPQRLRGKGMTITTLANWITNFCIAKAVPVMILPANFNLWGTFLFFACLCLFMAAFVLFGLPETKGVPLENMEALFDVWLKDTPLAEKMTLRGDSAQVRADRKHAADCENEDTEMGATEPKQ